MKKLALLFALLSIGISTQAQDQKMTPELLWELGRVSLYDLSPDEKMGLYGVTYYDLQTNKSTRDLFLIQMDGGAKGVPIRLTDTPEKESAACYHPNGEKIGYLKGGYLWEMNLDGSKAKQVSDFKMNGFKYSPSGQHILYIDEVKYDKTVTEQYPDLPLASGRIMDDLMYRHWTEWEDGYYSNIFIAPYKNGKIKGESINIMKEPYDAPTKPFGGMEQINWSPDGKKIAYTCKKLKGKKAATSTNTDIYLYDLARGKAQNITPTMRGYDMEPVFSPDGKYIAWNSMSKAGYESDRNRIFMYSTEDKNVWEVTGPLDMNANHPQWAQDSKSLYFSSTVKATNHIFQIDFNKKGKLRQLTNGHFNYYDFVVGKTNILARRASMSAPHELFRVTRDAGRASQITYTNREKLANVKMGLVKKTTVKTTDDKNMLTWIIYPPDFDKTKKYPTLLYCQGGPQSAVSQFWSYRWNFQMMAAKGYIVIAPNRRGLPSFGREWNDQIAGDWGGQAMQDLLSATDYAAELSYVDSTRIGAVGASYGGFSVYWLAGNHNKRFKSFISHCGLFNFESWYGTTEELFFANHDFKGSYWQENQPETYQRDSPHRYVQNWDTPMLVIHNEKDFRVPIGQGMEAFQAARLQDLKSRFLYFPDEGHWVLSPQNGVLWQRVFFEWLSDTL